MTLAKPPAREREEGPPAFMRRPAGSHSAGHHGRSLSPSILSKGTRVAGAGLSWLCPVTRNTDK